MNPTILDFLRHGEPVGGARYRGHSIDDPLSTKGWEQMWSAVAEAGPWQRVLTSPMLRCRAFAEAYAQAHDLPVEVDKRLREVGFGAWEGLGGAEILAQDPDGLSRFYHDPVNNRPDGAEDLDAFLGRVGAALDEALERFRGQAVLVVAHAGVIRAAVAHVLGAPAGGMYRIQVGNASLTRFRDDGIRPLTLHLGA
jgi:broad specificity phosphatase PhoE